MEQFTLQRFLDKPRLVLEFLRLFWRQFNDNAVRDSAAALTYTTLFAIVPMMTVAFTLLRALPMLQDGQDDIQRWAFEYFAPSVGNQVLDQLAEFARQASNLSLVGAVFLFVTSVLMLRRIEITLNRIWRVRYARQGATGFLMYWGVLTFGPLCLGVGLGLSSYLTSVKMLSGAADMLGGVAFWLSMLPLLASAVMMSVIYVVVPNCHVPWRQGVAGGIVAALFFELAKAGFALFIRSSPSYSVVYGAFAAVPLFLLWLYISWVIFLSGAVLAHSMVIFEEQRKQAPRLQALLRLLNTLWRNQQTGVELKPSQVRAALLASGATRWDDFRNLLMDIGLMRRTADNGFVLVRDLSHLTLAELITMLPWPVTQALRVSDQRMLAWEDDLAGRCEQAQQGFLAPLDIALEDLFELSEVRDG